MINQFAENYAKKGLVRLREIFTPESLKVPKTPAALKELESIHKVSFVASKRFISSLKWSSERVNLGANQRQGSIMIMCNVMASIAILTTMGTVQC